MKKMFRHIVMVAVAMLALSSLTSCNYNSLVEKRENADQQWAQVENVYQRRADLIPNLVNTVKGYASHESETLQAVVEARAKATSINIDPKNLDEASLKKFQDAQGELSAALGKLLAVTEAYPDLKANQNFMALQAQLEGTENRIATERKRYTEAVRDYNVSIKKFPTTIYAGWFGFEEMPQFKAEPGAEKAPEVKF
ncbi:MAG: LemA family protein [Porphyromonadaceae bacterium]|nr:LemA family protein [Porphyromonadaceae bacterium]